MRIVEREAELFELRLIELEDLVVGELAVVLFGKVLVGAIVQLVTRFALFFPRQLLFFFRTRSGSPGAHPVHDRA